MSRVKIGIIGCLGRMGKALTAETLNHNCAELCGATEMKENPAVGQYIRHPKTGEETAVRISCDAEELIKKADVVLDFTCPTATVMHASFACKHGTKLVVGTTGLSPSDEQDLKKSSMKTAIVYASNYSLGVNLLFHLTRKAAAVLGDDFDIEISETHHRDKIDAPSGTALSLGKEAAIGRGKKFDEIATAAHHGIGKARAKGEIGFASLRGGNIAGEHTVSFIADDEQIDLIHKAGNRRIFARGAIHAAIWICDKKSGLYDMGNVLGLE